MAKRRSNIPIILMVGAIYIGFALFVRYQPEIEEYWHRQIWGDAIGARASIPVEITAEPFHLYWTRRATLFHSAPDFELSLPAVDFGAWQRQQRATINVSPEGPEEVNLSALVPNTGSLSAQAMTGWCPREAMLRTLRCNATGVSITIKRDLRKRDTPFFQEPGWWDSPFMEHEETARAEYQFVDYWLKAPVKAGDPPEFLGGNCDSAADESRPGFLASILGTVVERPKPVHWTHCFSPENPVATLWPELFGYQRRGFWHWRNQLWFTYHGRMVTTTWANSLFPAEPSQAFLAAWELLERLARDTRQPPTSLVLRERALTAFQNCQAVVAAKAMGTETNQLEAPVAMQCEYAIQLALPLLKEFPSELPGHMLSAIDALRDDSNSWGRWYAEYAMDALRVAKLHEAPMMAHAQYTLSRFLPKSQVDEIQVALIEAARLLEPASDDHYELYGKIHEALDRQLSLERNEVERAAQLENWQAAVLRRKGAQDQEFLKVTQKLCLALQYAGFQSVGPHDQLKTCADQLLPFFLPELESSAEPSIEALYNAMYVIEFYSYYGKDRQRADEVLPVMRKLAALIDAHTRPNHEPNIRAHQAIQRAESALGEGKLD